MPPIVIVERSSRRRIEIVLDHLAASAVEQPAPMPGPIGYFRFHQLIDSDSVVVRIGNAAEVAPGRCQEGDLGAEAVKPGVAVEYLLSERAIWGRVKFDVDSRSEQEQFHE